MLRQQCIVFVGPRSNQTWSHTALPTIVIAFLHKWKSRSVRYPPLGNATSPGEPVSLLGHVLPKRHTARCGQHRAVLIGGIMPPRGGGHRKNATSRFPFHGLLHYRRRPLLGTGRRIGPCLSAFQGMRGSSPLAACSAQQPPKLHP
jgi:hypothetical protein